MAEYTVVVNDDAVAAGIALLGSREAFERELQAGIDKMVSPWVAKYLADTAKAEIVAAAAMKEAYDRVKAANPVKAAEIDALLVVFGSVPNEEPLEP
jgi:hypothetical protein